MKESLNDKYKIYCRPKVARLIETINLDKVYIKASGDYIYYKNEGKKTVKVLDFLGGYGASFFGHNHPDLIKVAKDNLNKMIPFHSQISTRHRAALLCEKLDEMMHSSTGQHFVTTLANSGTEGVEAAIKHAMLVQHNSNQYIHDELQKTLLKLSVANNNETFTYSDNFLRLVVDKLDVNPDSLFDEHLWHVLNYNDQLFKRPPFIIALNKAFHGKTTGSVQLTFNKDYRMPFSRVSGKTIFVDPNKQNELERAVKLATFHFYFPFINENNEIDIAEKKHCNITAMFIEPIQGEGGIQVISREYMEYARKVATENHFPLIFDEIQSGMGRTGRFLASEHQGVVADYYVLSKSLGGGLAKISAMLVQKKQYEDDFGFLHTSTFTEDDHSSDIALAALNLLDKDNSLYDNCRKIGDYLIKEFNNLKQEYPDIIEDVRGMGLMIGLQLKSQKESRSTVLRVLSEQKLLLFVVAGYLLNEHQIRIAPTLSESNTIRIEPSAYITEEECQKLIQALKMVCEIFLKENAYMLLRYTVTEKKRPGSDEIKDYRSTDNHVHELVEKDIRKVAFVGHFISAKHFPLYDRSFVEFKDKELEQLLDKFHEVLEPQITDSIVVHSKTGDKIRFLFVAYMISSRIIEEYMKQHNVNPLRKKIESAVNIAVKNGCRVIGFGGYTSIVTRNAKSIITDNIALTTGNSYTVASGVEALHRAIKRKKIDTETSCLAAIGASGNICSVYCEIMAENIPNIILIGRKGKEKNLEQVEEKIYSNAFQEIEIREITPGKKKKLKGVTKMIANTQAVKTLLKSSMGKNVGKLLREMLTEELNGKKPVTISTDINDIKKAQLVVTASNTADSVIFPDMVREESIICDIAVPQDVDRSVIAKRPDVMVIQGGIIKLPPQNKDFYVKGTPLKTNEAYACMSETMLLGLSGIYENYSFGSVERYKVKKIVELAKLHGFSLGKFKTEKSF